MLKRMWRIPPWRNDADRRDHQRPKESMGRVPVAPSKSRLPWEGEKKVRGFREKPVDEGFRRMDRK
jgi:hypothetical protein